MLNNVVLGDNIILVTPLKPDLEEAIKRVNLQKALYWGNSVDGVCFHVSFYCSLWNEEAVLSQAILSSHPIALCIGLLLYGIPVLGLNHWNYVQLKHIAVLCCGWCLLLLSIVYNLGGSQSVFECCFCARVFRTMCYLCLAPHRPQQHCIVCCSEVASWNSL